MTWPNVMRAAGALLLGLAARLCCEALHPNIAAVTLVAGVLLIAEARS